MATKFIEVSDNFTTAESLIFSQQDGERSIVMASGATSLIDAQVGARLAKNFAKNCEKSIFSTEISQVPLSGVSVLLEAAAAAGNVTVLDVDVVPSVAVDQAKLGSSDELSRCVQLAHVLKPSHIAACELIEMLTGKRVPLDEVEDYGKLTMKLLQATPAQMVALTSGSQGCVIAVKKQGQVELVKVAPHKIEAVLDATGAGDAFLGGLIAGLYPMIRQGRSLSSLSTVELTRLGNLANATGAACCRVLGGLPDSGSFNLVKKFEPAAAELLKQNAPARSPSGGVAMTSSSSREDRVKSLHYDSVTAVHVASTLAASQILDVVKIIRDRVREKNMVLVTGAGKSGMVGQRLAASLRSVSVPAVFVPAADWAHGDLGISGPNTSPVVVCFSHSGATSECVEAQAQIRKRYPNVAFVSVVGKKDSPLAQFGLRIEYSLPAGVHEPFGKVPTCSLVAQEMVANALLRELIGQQDAGLDQVFLQNHPGGAIGQEARK